MASILFFLLPLFIAACCFQRLFLHSGNEKCAGSTIYLTLIIYWGQATMNSCIFRRAVMSCLIYSDCLDLFTLFRRAKQIEENAQKPFFSAIVISVVIVLCTRYGCTNLRCWKKTLTLENRYRPSHKLHIGWCFLCITATWSIVYASSLFLHDRFWAGSSV